MVMSIVFVFKSSHNRTVKKSTLRCIESKLDHCRYVPSKFTNSNVANQTERMYENMASILLFLESISRARYFARHSRKIMKEIKEGCEKCLIRHIFITECNALV